jgi:hypothetical protein
MRELSKELGLCLVVLFGSYARGDHTVASDIDLLVVYEGPERPGAYDLVWDTLQLPNLQLHLYTKEKYEELKRSGSSFLKEAERGTVLWAPK